MPDGLRLLATIVGGAVAASGGKFYALRDGDRRAEKTGGGCDEQNEAFDARFHGDLLSSLTASRRRRLTRSRPGDFSPAWKHTSLPARGLRARGRAAPPS
jgi:hypothetical protein